MTSNSSTRATSSSTSPRFLDRIDRHEGDDDYRYAAMKNALPILLSDRPDRARAVLESFSDHSTDVSECAPFQGAFGAALPERKLKVDS